MPSNVVSDRGSAGRGCSAGTVFERRRTAVVVLAVGGRRRCSPLDSGWRSHLVLHRRATSRHFDHCRGRRRVHEERVELDCGLEAICANELQRGLQAVEPQQVDFQEIGLEEIESNEVELEGVSLEEVEWWRIEVLQRGQPRFFKLGDSSVGQHRFEEIEESVAVQVEEQMPRKDAVL